MTLVEAGALDIGAATISGAFNVNTNGAITDSGTIVVTGATFAAGAATTSHLMKWPVIIRPLT